MELTAPQQLIIDLLKKGWSVVPAGGGRVTWSPAFVSAPYGQYESCPNISNNTIKALERRKLIRRVYGRASGLNMELTEAGKAL